MLGLRAAPGHLCRPPLPPAPRAVNLTSERVLGTPAGAGGWVAPGGDSGDSGGHTHGHTEAGAGGGRTPAPPPPPHPWPCVPGTSAPRRDRPGGSCLARRPRRRRTGRARPASWRRVPERSATQGDRSRDGPLRRAHDQTLQFRRFGKPSGDSRVRATLTSAARWARGAGPRDDRGPARSRDFAGVVNLWGGFFFFKEFLAIGTLIIFKNF